MQACSPDLYWLPCRLFLGNARKQFTHLRHHFARRFLASGKVRNLLRKISNPGANGLRTNDYVGLLRVRRTAP